MGNTLARKQFYLVDHQPRDPIAFHDIEYLVFSVGSVRGLALLSAYITLLGIAGPLKIRGVAGVSAGAIMCLLVALGLNENEMRAIPTKKRFDQLSRLKPQKICNRWSLFDSEPIRDALVEAMTKKHVPPQTTFAQMHMDIHIFAIDHASDQLVAFSKKTTPNYCVLDAVIASCSMPFVFPAVPDHARCLIDGAAKESFPLRTFPSNHTLGFYLYDKYRPDRDHEFFTSLSEAEKDRIISIDVSRMSALDFHPTNHMLHWIWKQGQEAVFRYFSTLPSVRT